ncbi:unnamed protein product [Acanthoscelides obtectus]|uniref:Uncharacterized protein n=1 Tax=Acanthoscelides obtectus TaxID=200917 RepID=A0A9P0PM79_ACAOB|nr:unnamed protein product [Acanthoscelides obtectus]CAK1662648.1 Aldehyde dehydrogenase [Acanthoscelides obtectus]
MDGLNLDVTQGDSFGFEKYSMCKALNMVQSARRAFASNKTRSTKFRKTQLKELVKFLEKEEKALCTAVYDDLKKPKAETILHEILTVIKEAREAVNSLQSWMSLME